MKNNDLGENLLEAMNQALDHAKGEVVEGVRTRKVTITPVPHYKGEKIKSIRNKLHLSQKAFAFALGVSNKTVEAWESGKNEPAGSAQRLIDMLMIDDRLLEKYNIISVE